MRELYIMAIMLAMSAIMIGTGMVGIETLGGKDAPDNSKEFQSYAVYWRGVAFSNYVAQARLLGSNHREDELWTMFIKKY